MPEKRRHRADSGGFAEPDPDVPTIAMSIAVDDLASTGGCPRRLEAEADHRSGRHLFVGAGLEHVFVDREIHQRLPRPESVPVQMEDGRTTRQRTRRGREEGGGGDSWKPIGGLAHVWASYKRSKKLGGRRRNRDDPNHPSCTGDIGSRAGDLHWFFRSDPKATSHSPDPPRRDRERRPQVDYHVERYRILFDASSDSP